MDILEGDGWEIRVGSCLELEWPDVDHVLSDPPYSAHTFRKARRAGGRGAAKVAQLDAGYSAIDAEGIDRFGSIVGQHCARWCVFAIDHEGRPDWAEALDSHGLEHVRVGVFRKLNPTPQFTGDRPGQGTDAVQISHRAGVRKRWNGGGLSAYWEACAPRGRKQQRKGQKPESLLRTWVEQFTDPDDLICDPFCGSGTTGVAAVQLGRRFVGFEIDPEVAAAAAKRIQAASRQCFFALPATKPDQLALIDH